MPYVSEHELPLGGTTGAGEVCGSVGTTGLAAPFWSGGLAEGVRSGAATEQCKSLHMNADDDGFLQIQRYLLEELLDRERK
jgi:hypothetical protein